MNNERMDKVNELVKRELSAQILAMFPDFFVSVTKVEVSRDLSHGKIWISSLKDTEKICREIQNESKNLRKILAEKLILRKVPTLYFVTDLTEEKAEKIEKLIAEIKKDKNNA